MSNGLSRRSLLGSAGALGAAAVPVAAQQSPGAPEFGHQGPASPGTSRFFLNVPEERFVAAAVDRLIPPDR